LIAEAMPIGMPMSSHTTAAPMAIVAVTRILGGLLSRISSFTGTKLL
jgi:hypothetical protein